MLSRGVEESWVWAIASKPSHLEGCPLHADLGGFRNFFSGPCSGSSSVGHTPSHSNLSGNHGDGCQCTKSHVDVRPAHITAAAVEKSEGRT